MRIVTKLGAALYFFAANTWAQGGQSACALLPAERVSSIVGKAVRIDSAGSTKAALQPSICFYRGEGVAIRFAMRTSDTELAARAEFERQLAELFRDATPQSLRGVGTEARFGTLGRSGSGAIVARYDTTVIVLSGSQDQALLVALARSAIAQLSAIPHKAHP